LPDWLVASASDEILFKKYRKEYEKIAYKAEEKFYHDKFNTKCKILNNYALCQKC